MPWDEKDYRGASSAQRYVESGPLDQESKSGRSLRRHPESFLRTRTYLQSWRVSLAQHGCDGTLLKIIAGEVGYGSEAALSRAFKAHIGVSLREWRSQHRSAD